MNNERNFIFHFHVANIPLPARNSTEKYVARRLDGFEREYFGMVYAYGAVPNAQRIIARTEHTNLIAESEILGSAAKCRSPELRYEVGSTLAAHKCQAARYVHCSGTGELALHWWTNQPTS
jgi:hypothetical protein